MTEDSSIHRHHLEDIPTRESDLVVLRPIHMWKEVQEVEERWEWNHLSNGRGMIRISVAGIITTTTGIETGIGGLIPGAAGMVGHRIFVIRETSGIRGMLEIRGTSGIRGT